MTSVNTKNDFSSAVVDAAKAQTPSDFVQLRTQAAEALASLNLPGQKSEEYRFTPIVRTLEKHFPQWPTGRPTASSIEDVGPFLINGLDTAVVVIVNGAYNEKLSTLKGGAFTVHSLNSLHAQSDVLFRLADFTKDPFVALNTASFSGGVFIDVANNTNVSKPVLVLNIADATSGQVVSHARIAIKMGAGSNLTLISRNVCVGDHASFITLVEEALVSEGARLDYCRIQDTPGEVSFTQTHIQQLSRSHVNTFTLTLDGKLVRNNLSIAIDGEHSESHFHGLYLLDGETVADNHTVVDHRKPNSVSNELYKGVMDGKSKAIFNGKIFVRPDAQKTNAFQSNRNILLSELSTINTKPQLEIWADDVKCSHGCTTGQLDEEALFYLRSRGIPRQQARAMLLYAFAAETFSFIANEELRAYINGLVSARLNKLN